MNASILVQERPRTPVAGLPTSADSLPGPDQSAPAGKGRPLPLLGLCFGTALLLGLLCRSRPEGKEELALRARQWEERAQRLMAIARAQEQDLIHLRHRLARSEAPS